MSRRRLSRIYLDSHVLAASTVQIDASQLDCRQGEAVSWVRMAEVVELYPGVADTDLHRHRQF